MPPLTAVAGNKVQAGATRGHVYEEEDVGRRSWHLTREIPRSWRPDGRAGRSARTDTQLALKQPSTTDSRSTEIYGRSIVRSVGPPLRRRPVPPGQEQAGTEATAPDAHLQNEPVYVTRLRNPMWKSAKAVTQAEEDASQARLAQAERERVERKWANAQKEKQQAEEMGQRLRSATRSGNWEQVMSLLTWRTPVEGYKVDPQATDSDWGEQEAPVMAAARAGQVEAVIALVEAGAPPPQPDGLQRWEDEDESVMQKALKLASIRTQLRDLQKEETDAQKALEDGAPALAKAVEERDRLKQQLKEQEANDKHDQQLTTRQRRARRVSVEQMIEEYDIGADGIIDQLERQVFNAKKVIKSSVMPIATATKRIKHLTAEWHLAFPKEKPPAPRALSPEKASALVQTYNTIQTVTVKNIKRWQLAARVASIPTTLNPSPKSPTLAKRRAKSARPSNTAAAAADDAKVSALATGSTTNQAAMTQVVSEDPDASSQFIQQNSAVSAMGTGVHVAQTATGGAPLLFDMAMQESPLVPAAPVYLEAKQHRAGTRTMEAIASAEANAVVSSRGDFIALKGPSHLKAWSAKITKRGGAIEQTIRTEAAITGRRAKIDEPAPPAEPHRPIHGPTNPLVPGKRAEIAPTTISAWSGQLVRDAHGIPRAFGVKSTPGTSPRRQPGFFATAPLVRQRPATDGGSSAGNRRLRLHELQRDRHDPAFLVDAITGERQQLGYGCTVPMWSSFAGGRRRVGSARSASVSTTSSSRGGKLLTEQSGARLGFSVARSFCNVPCRSLWSWL